jgi:hypothetical protein
MSLAQYAELQGLRLLRITEIAAKRFQCPLVSFRPPSETSRIPSGRVLLRPAETGWTI